MKYWVTIQLTAHDEHPPSYPGPAQPELKALYDETGAERPVVARSEYTIGPLTMRVAKLYAFTITEAEYNQWRRQKTYLWAEPAGIVAFMEPRSHEGVAVGRIQLSDANAKLRGASPQALPQVGVAQGDMRIHYEVTLVNSVVQYMADEITRNIADPRVTQIAKQMQDLKDARRRAEATPDTWTVPSDNPLGAAPNPGVITRPAQDLWNWGHDRVNQWRWGRQVHKDEGWAGFGQEIVFLGGGQWDHKPRIRPVWGAYNRLGNLDEVWFYDIWSNIHYGCVGRAAGMPLEVLTSGAGAAQAVDSGSTTGDDAIDAEGIIAGWDLYAGARTYTVEELMDILKKHPHWEIKTRFPGK